MSGVAGGVIFLGALVHRDSTPFAPSCPPPSHRTIFHHVDRAPFHHLVAHVAISPRINAKPSSFVARLDPAVHCYSRLRASYVDRTIQASRNRLCAARFAHRQHALNFYAYTRPNLKTNRQHHQNGLPPQPAREEESSSRAYRIHSQYVYLAHRVIATSHLIIARSRDSHREAQTRTDKPRRQARRQRSHRCDQA
jgi:hypothetical protein